MRYLVQVKEIAGPGVAGPRPVPDRGVQPAQRPHPAAPEGAHRRLLRPGLRHPRLILGGEEPRAGAGSRGPRPAQSGTWRRAPWRPRPPPPARIQSGLSPPSSTSVGTDTRASPGSAATQPSAASYGSVCATCLHKAELRAAGHALDHLGRYADALGEEQHGRLGRRQRGQPVGQVGADRRPAGHHVRRLVRDDPPGRQPPCRRLQHELGAGRVADQHGVPTGGRHHRGQVPDLRLDGRPAARPGAERPALTAPAPVVGPGGVSSRPARRRRRRPCCGR